MVENQHNVSQMEQIVAKSASLWLTKAAKHFFVRMMATKQCRRSSSISGTLCVVAGRIKGNHVHAEGRFSSMGTLHLRRE
jgi:hypothetical protein